jgi:hypothetical protein
MTSIRRCDDLSYVSKIFVNVYRQCGLLLFSNVVYVCGLSCICVLFVDSHVWMILFI